MTSVGLTTLTTEQIKLYAQKELGIDLIGITEAVFDSEGETRLKTFIENNFQGQMHYLEDYSKRVNPQKLLPGAKSVVVIAVNYYREKGPTPAGKGRVARYAYGRDYHKVFKKLLKKLAAFIQNNAPYSQNKICIDSAPLLEKGYAEKAGIGFTGKNTTLITYEYGSFVLLGEILTTLKLQPDKPKTGTCGTCTRCIDACPTKAIIGPGQLDARRCISYLTIENKGPIPEEFHKPIDNLIFGCDICQEVCPYNKAHAKPLTLKEFQEVKIAGDELDLNEILNISSDEEFLKRFAGSPLMRAKLKGLQRNANIVLNNTSLENC